MTNSTSYRDKCFILAELWLSYRGDEELQDFLEANALGLPLAYAIDNDIVESSEKAQKFIEETFDLFLATLDIEDTGFENINELLG
jgi:hypothetical protein